MKVINNQIMTIDKIKLKTRIKTLFPYPWNTVGIPYTVFQPYSKGNLMVS
jgi:hypothetical protein